MSGLERFVAARNAELTTDALLKGGMGALFSLATFGFCAWIAYLCLLVGARYEHAATGALGIAAVFMAVATWSALRGVDPLAHLSPLTAGERSRRELEDAVRDVVGGGLEKALRRDAIAGFGGCLIAGPAGLVGAWRASRRRLSLDAPTLAEAERLLADAAADGAAVEGHERAALTLAHLGLVNLSSTDDGRVLARLSAKGKQL